jgi:hypothetical protein
MFALDTNVLVHAHRADMPNHVVAAAFLREAAEGTAPWAIPWPCIHEFWSVVTHRKIFGSAASTPKQAAAQLRAWLASPSLMVLQETENHADLLLRILELGNVRGPLVHDARILALCEAHHVEVLLTADRDFSKLPSRVRIESPWPG